jgi:two-component system NtrC family response regulator
MKSRILFIDDDLTGREIALFNLKKAGYDVVAASDGQDGLSRFSPDKFDLVITDYKMPGLNGLEVLQQIRKKTTDVPVLIITAFGNVDMAVEVMKAGAYDFIGKPFQRDQLLLSVEKAVERSRLSREVRELRIRASGVDRGIIFVSAAMKRVLDVAERTASTDASVLITGESGTGKEVVARRIHVRSKRAEGPFVAVNCAAIPGELLESELFGHAKGSFTGAVKDRVGRFRQAKGGTLFLDEVGEIPLPLQGKLLRALQERVVDVVGEDRPVPVDVRIVAATNRNLTERIRNGFFREDLYYRLNVVEIHAPSLRERPEDIPVLVEHFVQDLGADRGITVPEGVMAEMMSRSWPGNVREIKNACERMVILCRGTEVVPEDLPPRNSVAGNESVGEATVDDEWPQLPTNGISLIDLEKRVIERALRAKRGNITHAAAFLQIPRHILVYRLEKYGIRRDA